jgi:hypothetical protein
MPRNVKWFSFSENAILPVMNKSIIRILLLAAAVVFTVNLIAFSFGQWLIFPLCGAVFLLAVVAGPGFFIAWKLKIIAAGILEAAALGLMTTAGYFCHQCFDHPGILCGLGYPLAFPVAE